MARGHGIAIRENFVNVSDKYLCSEVIAWERFVDFVGLARRPRRRPGQQIKLASFNFMRFKRDTSLINLDGMSVRIDIMRMCVEE